MARPVKQVTEIRSALETIAGEVAFIRTISPVTRLRVQQGMDQTGMTSLFSPALDELDYLSCSVDVIDQQVRSALAKLME